MKLKPHFKLLKSFFKEELLKRAKKSKHISKDSIIDVIYENPSHFGSLDENYITSGILQYLRTSALISSPRLINILVDISLYPKVSKKLVHEQSEIINKCSDQRILKVIFPCK
ncbi:hypothetical protein AYI69_g10765 [Smittium culicis]|uniref:Uncharacterized protein n=1 Tax=Smittium culicis TaxID=133412 RepID=A0A1R1X3Q7_9FUNG|nr:hypothetical protein AYI69_g10765 [Smittium culicis]